MNYKPVLDVTVTKEKINGIDKYNFISVNSKGKRVGGIYQMNKNGKYTDDVTHKYVQFKDV